MPTSGSSASAQETNLVSPQMEIRSKILLHPKSSSADRLFWYEERGGFLESGGGGRATSTLALRNSASTMASTHSVLVLGRDSWPIHGPHGGRFKEQGS